MFFCFCKSENEKYQEQGAQCSLQQINMFALCQMEHKARQAGITLPPQTDVGSWPMDVWARSLSGGVGGTAG